MKQRWVATAKPGPNVVRSITVAGSNPKYVDDHGAPSSDGSDLCRVWSPLRDASSRTFRARA
jgi:hypothetical protein